MNRWSKKLDASKEQADVTTTRTERNARKRIARTNATIGARVQRRRTTDTTTVNATKEKNSSLRRFVVVVGAFFSAILLKIKKLSPKGIVYLATILVVVIVAPVVIGLAAGGGGQKKAAVAPDVSVSPATGIIGSLDGTPVEGEDDSLLEGDALPTDTDTAKSVASASGDAKTDVIPVSSEELIQETEIPLNAAPAASPGVITAAQVEAEKPVTSRSATPGLTSPLVTELQARLTELHYLEEDEPTDYYDVGIEEAVRRFQRKHGLEETGVADEETFALIFAEDAQKYAISEGVEGADVYELQARLVELNYLDLATDTYDDKMTEAVLKFQKRNGLVEDGKVGRETKEVLLSSDAKAFALSFGEESPEILELQGRLKGLGYLMTEPDGKYGGNTVAAVKRFQIKHDLVDDGHLGNTTKELLLSPEAQENSLGVSDGGDDVTRMQERLVELGYMSSATGYFGSGTEDALKDFQKRNGLSEDGRFGVSTNNVLFSADAKRAPAPTPPKNTTNNATNSGSSSSNKGKGSSGGSPSSKGSSSGGSSGKTIPSTSGANVGSLISMAESRLGCPYRLGAKGPDVFDCSGFVYWCLNQIGVKQGYMTSGGWRSAPYQRIEGWDNVRAGDILVFQGHVGIAVGSDTMIDASSSKNAIVRRGFKTNYWAKKYICAYRIF
ncbi:MAG: peptidoglycan-binding protein [Christensenellaceae bacterium]